VKHLSIKMYSPSYGQAEARVIESRQHFAPLPIYVKMLHSQYYFEATVIHIQSPRIQICVYTLRTHILHNIEAVLAKEIK